ncbi:hypothetical protein B0H15DRAFT_952495 [Mycena belliarum]|uniref:YABBY protein C-terminal domain-containing protein n=1 Tax=Mycena belliarum TaxID=1033014 RepID=A0AAD6TWV6_9AGAR|nr:hypothetical protein B0H15DRAFT_952495 [Mycena belliae]
MAKTATVTKTKTATKDAKTKATKTKTNTDGTEKAKRPPSAYNNYVKEHMPKWRAENPDAPYRDGMGAVAALWANAPENPKRGQPVAKRAPKAAKEPKEKAAKPKAKASKKKEPEPEEDDDDDEEEDEDEKENASED